MGSELSPSPTSWVDRFARRSLWWGVGGSLVLHLLALGMVMMGQFHGWIIDRPLKVAEQGPIKASVTVVLPAPPANPPSFTLVSSPPSPTVTDAMVRSKLDDVVADAKGKSSAENLSKLDRLSNRLNDVTSEESLDDLTGMFQQWMGLQGRVDEPQAAAKVDEFDSNTAQLDDVERTAKPDGGWKYVARLIDKNGRTITVEMGEQEGVAAYELMQKLKANPLLEKIYRRIAMPLIDSLVKPPGHDSRAARATQSAEMPAHPEGIDAPTAVAP